MLRCISVGLGSRLVIISAGVSDRSFLSEHDVTTLQPYVLQQWYQPGINIANRIDISTTKVISRGPIASVAGWLLPFRKRTADYLFWSTPLMSTGRRMIFVMVRPRALTQPALPDRRGTEKAQWASLHTLFKRFDGRNYLKWGNSPLNVTLQTLRGLDLTYETISLYTRSIKNTNILHTIKPKASCMLY